MICDSSATGDCMLDFLKEPIQVNNNNERERERERGYKETGRMYILSSSLLFVKQVVLFDCGEIIGDSRYHVAERLHPRLSVSHHDEAVHDHTNSSHLDAQYKLLALLLGLGIELALFGQLSVLIVLEEIGEATSLFELSHHCVWVHAWVASVNVGVVRDQQSRSRTRKVLL